MSGQPEVPGSERIEQTTREEPLVALDDADMALLDELRKDGRASYERLGSVVGLSRTAARARVNRLLESGVVRIEAVVHPGVDGYSTFAHLSVNVHGAPVTQVAKEVATFPNAPFVSIVAGRCSLIAELRTRDVGELEESIARVRELPGVVSLDTVVYTDVVKDSYLPLGGPHSFEAFDIDAVDRRLLALLQRDARTPYADLADQVGLSRAATRARMLRLLDQGVVVVTGLVNPTAVGITSMCGFQVQLGAGAKESVAAIEQLGAVAFLARTIGRCDLIGTMIERGRSEMVVALDEIRLLEGVYAVQAWWHLELVKERYAPPVVSG